MYIGRGIFIICIPMLKPLRWKYWYQFSVKRCSIADWPEYPHLKAGMACIPAKILNNSLRVIFRQWFLHECVQALSPIYLPFLFLPFLSQQRFSLQEFLKSWGILEVSLKFDRPYHQRIHRLLRLPLDLLPKDRLQLQQDKLEDLLFQNKGDVHSNRICIHLNEE